MEMPMELQHQAMGYDRAATMFSPDGHLLQVEYAEKTVRLGPSSIGFVCSDGIVMVADRRMKDKLVTPESANKIHEIDSHIVATIAGIVSDGRILIERAQVIAQQHRVTYNSEIEVESVIKEIANMKQFFTQYGGARPFGVSVMIAGIHNQKKGLFVSDVTGNYTSYKAAVIGEDDEKIKEILRKKFDTKMKIDDAIKLALKIYKQFHAKTFDLARFDVAYITLKDKKIKRMHGDVLKKYIR